MNCSMDARGGDISNATEVRTASAGVCWGAEVALRLSRRSATSAPQHTPALAVRTSVAFDMSPPLASMEQFIPDKQVVIHPAVNSQAVRDGSLKGPGAGLGATPPTSPAARGGAGAGRAGRGGRAGGPPPVPPPPPAPEIGA